MQAAIARTAPIANTIELVGSLNPRDRIVISAEVGGTVAEVLVDFGDRIARDALLLHLDSREAALRADVARAALAQAAAACEQARTAHKRATAMHRQQVISEQEFDRAVSEWRMAEANRDAAAKQLALAEKHLADTALRSPVTGFVAARHVAVGQYVTAYAPVMELVVVDPLKLRLDVPERFAAAMREGLSATVELEAFPGEQFAATVTRVGATLDGATRTLPVESTVANPDARLKPGQFAKARIDLGMYDAVVVPRAAIDSFAGTQRAFVIRDDGRVEARTVSPGRDLGEEVVILDGIHAGETVVVSHLERLTDGTAVRAVPAGTS
ncbi:MAG: efflux RND transporter periplasmic adaptor subunit [Deltaproteobacteria bacterium]|nr:efflux RND transporter periplasmic adaptor subunit [Deltaproteobacteria bacterium]